MDIYGEETSRHVNCVHVHWCLREETEGAVRKRILEGKLDEWLGQRAEQVKSTVRGAADFSLLSLEDSCFRLRDAALGQLIEEKLPAGCSVQVNDPTSVMIWSPGRGLTGECSFCCRLSQVSRR